jgi:hypothetical protein
MGTNYIAPIWRMPRNANKDKLSNYSINFDGSNEFIDTTLDIDANSDFSISFWFNWDQDQRVIITDGSFDAWSSIGYGFQIMSNGSVSFLVGDSGASTGKTISSTAGSITANTWYHIVGVCDLSNEIRLYLNGTSVDNTAVGSSRNETSNNLRIAGDYSSTKRLFNGSISQVSVFNYALDSSQVSYLYNLNNPMAITGAEPVAYWPLGDNSNPNAPGSFPNISVGADSVFDFNASGYIDIPDSDTLSFGDGINDSPFTMSAWIKTTSSAGRGIISKWGNTGTSGYFF